MAASSSIPDQGFFTSAGVLRSEGVKTTATKSSEQTSTSTADASSSIGDQTAQATASAITDAVVVRIASQLNVGDTGFDSGVADNVREAVGSALSKLSAQQSPAFTPREIGGTYQNEILAQGKQSATPPPAAVTPPPVTPTPTPLPPPKESTPPKEDDDEIRKLAKRYVDRKSKNSDRPQSKEEQDKEVEKVREFYSRGDRKNRLKALVEGGED